MSARRDRARAAVLFGAFLRAALLYLLLTACLVTVIVQGDAGFSYSLDIPYLQLALAQHIAHGTYGIHAGETASPISSVVWPFLLAPFAEGRYRCWAPLLLNVCAGLGVCALVGFWIDRYFRDGWRKLPEVVRWMLALSFVVAANLPALALLGMEHTLQVLVAAGCAAGIAEAYFSRRIPAWSLVCAVVAPSVRYEDIAFSMAVCLACWFTGRRFAAYATAFLSVVPLVAFGVFLHAHGLPCVLDSVLTEGRILPASSPSSGMGHLAAIAVENMKAYVQDPQRWPVAILFLALCGQSWSVRRMPARRNALLSALIGLLLILLFGPYGYFYRLDVAYRFFSFLLVFAVAGEHKWFGAWPALGLGAIASAVYCLATLQTPAAAWSIAHEQKQVQRFAQGFYQGNLLTTDPGWIAFDSRDRFYVLDVGSIKTTQNKAAEAAWLEHAVQAHAAGLAVVSPRIPLNIPADWKRLASLYRYGDGFNRMDLFVTASGDTGAIRKELRVFAATLPAGTWLSYEDGERSDVPDVPKTSETSGRK